MERLWAPWRVKYVRELIAKRKGCVFCRINKEKKDRKNFIFIRTQYSFAVLNLYPYNNGHVLVLPHRHVNDFTKLRKKEGEDLWELLSHTKNLLDEVLHPHGYNIGINLGKVAGAGFPGHLHIHIVPRWKGDVNFMPAVGNMKVVPQSLSALHKLLMSAQKRSR